MFLHKFHKIGRLLLWGKIALLATVSALHASEATAFEEAILKPYFHVEPSSPNLSSLHKTSTLVISCVDFRLRDEVERLLREELHLLDDYDEIALPGASLAFVDSLHPQWGQSLEDMITILRQLHGIRRVIFLDHFGCGAYRLIQGEAAVKDKVTERSTHYAIMDEAREKILKEFPGLDVYTLLMDFNGDVFNHLPHEGRD